MRRRLSPAWELISVQTQRALDASSLDFNRVVLEVHDVAILEAWQMPDANQVCIPHTCVHESSH